MLEEIVNVIKDTALKHKRIGSFHYQSNILTNAQNGHKYFQCIVDDVSMHQLLVSYSPNIFTATFDIYIIGFVDTDTTILKVQDEAYDTALQIVMKMSLLETYKGLIEVHDYSILTLSHYTDDNSAGVKLTLELNIPFGFCDLEDYFDDEPKENEDEIIEEKRIELKPIRIKDESRC